MEIAGIVAEYDPFHRGHELHIQRTREQADAVVCVMTGWVTQRGACACLSKHERARMALLGGADAVFEFPAFFTVRPADAFASAGCSMLRDIGCDAISFGTETDPGLLRRAAGIARDEPEEVRRGIRERLDAGASYVRARAAAYAAYLGADERELSQPNAILACAYMAENRGDMREIAVPREGAYHGGELSASRVRRLAREGRREEARALLPEGLRSFADGIAPRDGDAAAIFAVRCADEAYLSSLVDAGEGLGTRLMRAAQTARTRREMADELVSPRYTRSRAQRLITQCELGITKESAAAVPRPAYARLLGFRKDREWVVSEIARRARIPVPSRPRDVPEGIVFCVERRAEALFAASGPLPAPAGDREYGEKLIVV